MYNIYDLNVAWFYEWLYDIFQLAVSNRLFSDEVGLDDLPCMNCLRVEMGERACYTGNYKVF